MLKRTLYTLCCISLIYLSLCADEFSNDRAPCCKNRFWRFDCTPFTVSTDPCYSALMLDRLNHRSWKQLILLDRWSRDEDPERVILSAQLRGSLFYTYATKDDKFGYLGRFPKNFRGDNASKADINDFTVSLTYSPLNWIHGYWEFLHSDQITFSTDPRQGSNQTQKVYAVIGDLNCTPAYLTIGKKDVSFGSMYTVNPFSPSVTWHYFGALHDGLAIGYQDHGLRIEGTILNGGRGVRVADTNEKGRLDNWALNALYEYCGGDWQVAGGVGYLYSTMYDGDPPEHEGPISKGPRNGAWNINLHGCWNGLEAYFEMTSTERSWKSTKHLVRTFSGGIVCELLEPWLDKPIRFSLEHGEGIQGSSGEEYRKNAQSVFGIDYTVHESVRFTFEYVHTKGFAPLMDITEPGVSVKKARSHVFQMGVIVGI